MAKDGQEPDVEGGDGKKKKLIIIGAAVAVAIILGVVAFLMLGKGDKKDKEEKGKEGAKTEAKAGGGHGAPAGGGKEGEGAAGAKMYPLEPFIVNIYDGQELRYLKVKVEMEMSAPAVKPEVDDHLAPIRDAILVLLSAKTLQDIQDAQGKAQLKDEILAAIGKLIPPGKVVRIYFTDFVVQ